MASFPNECIYSILLFLDPKCLQLCVQLDNTFHQLCRLESLWRNQIEDKYNTLFKKENYYQNCKLYYQLDTLKNKLELSKQIEEIYNLKTLDLSDNKNLKQIPKEIKLLTNMKILTIHYLQQNVLPSEIYQLPNLDIWCTGHGKYASFSN